MSAMRSIRTTLPLARWRALLTTEPLAASGTIEHQQAKDTRSENQVMNRNSALHSLRWRCALRLALWLVPLSTIIPLASLHAATNITPLQAEQRSDYPDVYTDGGQAQHVYGYQFTVLEDGVINRMGGRFSGTKQIALLDQTNGAIIATATVTGTQDAWTYAALDEGPVTVLGNRTYMIAARMQTNASGRAIWGISMPFEQAEIRVDSAIQGWSNATDPVQWAATVRSIPDQNMKGLLDVEFQANAGMGTTGTSSGTTSGGATSGGTAGDTGSTDMGTDGSDGASAGDVGGNDGTTATGGDTSASAGGSTTGGTDGGTGGGGNCIASTSANLQAVTAANSGCLVHESIDADAPSRTGPGKNHYWADTEGVRGTLSPACQALHDRYWTSGPDNRAYPTWHPPAAFHPDTGEGCVFGHEHGEDPSTSPVFDYSGGWPPFGYVVKTKSSQRVEDHFGHKITVASFRAGIGNHPQDTASEGVPPPAIHDAGFDCHWLSKLHQGSYSLDAFSNHLHEYFLTVRCDGEPVDAITIDPWKVNARTEFSIKALVPFGSPNSFSACGDGNFNSINSVTGPNGESLQPAQVTAPVTAEPNPRGFNCFNPVDSKYSLGIADSLNRYDIWTQPYTVSGPNNLGIRFQAYYIVKEPARSLNAAVDQIQWTTELCQQNPGLNFCAAFENNGSPAWDSTLSPFRGALRAVNFKRLAIYNNHPDDPDTFCTDVHGKNPSLPVAAGAGCPPDRIEQRIGKRVEQDALPGVAAQNLWDHLGISGSLFVYDQTMKYRLTNLDGSQNPLDASQFFYVGSDPTGLQPLNESGICPASGQFTRVLPELQQRFGQGYCPLGIGFEEIVDMRNIIETRYAAEAAAVGFNSSGQRFNTDIHAPN